jgi:hypothetical protein
MSNDEQQSQIKLQDNSDAPMSESENQKEPQEAQEGQEEQPEEKKEGALIERGGHLSTIRRQRLTLGRRRLVYETRVDGQQFRREGSRCT